MEQKKSSFSVALKYGIMAGLVSFIFSIILYLTALYLNQGLQWIAYLFLIGGIILSIKELRDKVQNGNITFGQGFGNGFYVTLVFTILSIIFSLLMTQVIAPDMMNEILKMSEQKMIDRGMSDEQVEIAMNWTRKFMTPMWMSAWILIWNVIVGVILSLIVAGILKKDNPNLQPPQA